jgi:hypothetical protein
MLLLHHSMMPEQGLGLDWVMLLVPLWELVKLSGEWLGLW